MAQEMTQAEVVCRHAYPIVVGVEYKLAVDGRPVRIGRGRTVMLSSTLITFITAEPLPRGRRIDLVMEWPALLNGKVGLRLCIKGRVVESKANYATVEIIRYEFRTRYLKSAEVQSEMVKPLVFNHKIQRVTEYSTIAHLASLPAEYS